MLDRPIRIAVPLEHGVARGLVAERDVSIPVQVPQHTKSSLVQFWSGATHRATQHSSGKSDVGSSVGRGIEQSAADTLVSLEELRVGRGASSRSAMCTSMGKSRSQGTLFA